MRGIKFTILLFLLTVAGASAQGVMEKYVQKAGVDTVEQKRLEYEFYFAEAAKQKMLGNLTGSINIYLKCSSIRPDRSVPYYELANLLFVEGEIERARANAEKAIAIDPKNEWYKYIAIEICTTQEKFLDGAKYYRDLYTDFKDDTKYRTGEIDLLVRGGDQKNALKKLDELEKIFGFSKYTAIRKKEIYLATGKEKQAFKELERLIKKFPGEVETMGILAELYAERGQEEKALALFNEMKEMNSGNPLVSFSLGQYYFELDRKEEAIEEFKTGFASKQVNPEIKIQVFIELVRNQNGNIQLNDNMGELLEVMYETDKEHPGVDGLFADYLYNMDSINDAELIYKRIVKNAPSNFLAWQNLLFIQNTQADYDEMYSIGKEAVANFPNQPLLLLFKGMGAGQAGHLEESIEALKSGLRINLNNPELTKQFYISLGDAYYQANKYEQAFGYFEDLLALDPDNVIVLNNYSYYLSLLDRDLDKAQKMIEKCVNAEKDNPTYLDTYAWVLYKNKNYKKALEMIEKAIKLDPEPSGEVYEHHGDILFTNNRVEEAKSAWKKAEKTGDASSEINEKIRSGLK